MKMDVMSKLSNLKLDISENVFRAKKQVRINEEKKMKYLILTLFALILVGCNTSATVDEDKFVLAQTPNLTDNGYDEDYTYRFKQMYASPSFNSGVTERNPHITNLGNESWQVKDIVKNSRKQTYHIKSFHNTSTINNAEKKISINHYNAYKKYTYKIKKNKINMDTIEEFSNNISDSTFGHVTYIDENNEDNYIDSTKFTISAWPRSYYRGTPTSIDDFILGAKLDLPDNLLTSTLGQPLFAFEAIPKETYVRKYDGEVGTRSFVAVGGDKISGLPTGTHQYGGLASQQKGILTANSRSYHLIYDPANLNPFSTLTYGSGYYSLGTVFVEANFDNLTGSVYDVAMDTNLLSRMEGNININAIDGSFTGNGEFTTYNAHTNISVIGNFHGNQAEGVSGIYYSDTNNFTYEDTLKSFNLSVIGWFVAKKR